MKGLIGWAVSWSLFGMGDLVSRLLRLDSVDRWPKWLVDVVYGAYNRLMCASCDVQDWGGAGGPWEKA